MYYVLEKKKRKKIDVGIQTYKSIVCQLDVDPRICRFKRMYLYSVNYTYVRVNSVVHLMCNFTGQNRG